MILEYHIYDDTMVIEIYCRRSIKGVWFGDKWHKTWLIDPGFESSVYISCKSLGQSKILHTKFTNYHYRLY